MNGSRSCSSYGRAGNREAARPHRQQARPGSVCRRHDAVRAGASRAARRSGPAAGPARRAGRCSTPHQGPGTAAERWLAPGPPGSPRELPRRPRRGVSVLKRARRQTTPRARRRRTPQTAGYREAFIACTTPRDLSTGQRYPKTSKSEPARQRPTGSPAARTPTRSLRTIRTSAHNAIATRLIPRYPPYQCSWA